MKLSKCSKGTTWWGCPWQEGTGIKGAGRPFQSYVLRRHNHSSQAAWPEEWSHVSTYLKLPTQSGCSPKEQGLAPVWSAQARLTSLHPTSCASYQRSVMVWLRFTETTPEELSVWLACLLFIANVVRTGVSWEMQFQMHARHLLNGRLPYAQVNCRSLALNNNNARDIQNCMKIIWMAVK